VRTVEISGPVGSGKTSLVEPLRDAFASRGRQAVTLDEAVESIMPRPGRRARLAAATRFVVRQPAFVMTVLSSLMRAPIPWWHRRRIALLVLKLGSRLDLLRSRLDPQTTVIIDEGWLHRAVNVFAWRTTEPSRRELEGYLDRAHLAELVILLSADPDTVRGRAANRGLPRRLVGRTDAEVESFLARGERILARAEAALCTDPRGMALIRVRNDGSPAELRVAIERALEIRRVPRVPPHRPRWPSVLRPDRLAGRLRRRGPNLLPERLARDVADAVGLEAPVPIRGGVSPGGRGRVRALRDRHGRYWLVKRYKDSVADADIAVELAILRRLAELTLPGPRLAPAPAGSDGVVRLEGGRFAVYELAEGYVHPHERWFVPSDRRRLEMLSGTLLAALHTGLRGFAPPAASQHGFVSLHGPRVRPVGWFTDRLASLAGRSEVRDQLSVEEAAGVAAALVELDAVLEDAELERGVVHGDYGPYNLLVRSGREPLAIDWELSRLDWLVVDLATAIPRFAQRRSGWDAAAAGRFLDAYRRRSAIGARQLRLVPVVARYLALRRMVVCLDRWVSTGDRRPRAEAGERLAVARQLEAGTHPLNRLFGALS
jgi:Ser/Thr protein kinase RdoA (MazF antagonist)